MNSDISLNLAMFYFFDDHDFFFRNGTSMISLIIPPKDQIARVSKMLADEFGTASNIKSRVNRLSVLSAITSVQQRLKLYTKGNQIPYCLLSCIVWFFFRTWWKVEVVLVYILSVSLIKSWFFSPFQFPLMVLLSTAVQLWLKRVKRRKLTSISNHSNQSTLHYISAIIR